MTYWKWKLHFLKFRFWRWLQTHEPVFCAGCGRLVFEKNVKREMSLIGRMENVCPECHKKYFGGE